MSVADKSFHFISMQGVLEKLKEREFPWILSNRKYSTTWVLRYYVLRHADVPDPEAFLLEQHEDATPSSKVRKALDLRRVVQVDTNISLKVGSQNWILAIHYKSKHGKLKVLYLAAHSEQYSEWIAGIRGFQEMNLWITKLCCACRLERQDDEADSPPISDGTAYESSVVANPRTNSSAPSGLAYDQFRLEPSRLFNNSNSNSNGSYSNPVSTHAYIRLKDCSSSRSLGSSSASLCSTVTTSSSSAVDHSASENVSYKNSSDFMIPPPIPPKPSPSIRPRKYEGRSAESGSNILDQPLTPPDINEVLAFKDEDCSGETICPEVVKMNESDTTPVAFDSLTSLNPTAPVPLPRRSRDHPNIPPEVDRSCKPMWNNRNRRVSTGNAHDSQSVADWKEGNSYAITPRMYSAHFSTQQWRPVLPQNKQVLFGQDVLYGNGLNEATTDTLDYLEPPGGSLAEPPLPPKPSQRPKTSCATEYTQIDESSTKAVLEANVRQDQLRRGNGFPV